MAARSIGSLSISFGLVSIPVKLFSATEASRAISFNLLHKACGSRLKQQYLCVKEDIPVAREDMAKGFEFAKDQYVMFTPQELKALEEAGTQIAEIAEFVPIEAIDPMFFDKAYYLAPDKFGAKPYALFAKALRESKRCAVGRWAARGKQYIVMIRAVEEGLVMQQLLYATEVRSIKEIDIPQTEVKDAELKLARQLIDHQTTDLFDASAYTDEVRARVEVAVQKKVEGQEITIAEAPEAGSAQVIDLMEALRASLEKKAPARARETRTETRKPPKRAQAEPAAKKAVKRYRGQVQATVRPPCSNTGCATSRSCFICRGARSARWSRPGSCRPRAGHATPGCSRSRIWSSFAPRRRWPLPGCRADGSRGPSGSCAATSPTPCRSQGSASPRRPTGSS